MTKQTDHETRDRRRKIYWLRQQGISFWRIRKLLGIDHDTFISDMAARKYSDAVDWEPDPAQAKAWLELNDRMSIRPRVTSADRRRVQARRSR